MGQSLPTGKTWAGRGMSEARTFGCWRTTASKTSRKPTPATTWRRRSARLLITSHNVSLSRSGSDSLAPGRFRRVPRAGEGAVPPTPSLRGHIQQFLIAALLHEYRRRYSIEITTHHPHAADKFDETAGDIEERRDGQLGRAYEVTVRDDWKNRISNFKKKMDRFGLSKYIIIAAGINTDSEWKEQATMALKLEPYGGGHRRGGHLRCRSLPCG